MFLVPVPKVATPANEYKIIKIERQSIYAGKMGEEVRENWVVSRNGQEIRVRIAPYHTHVARTPEMFHEGETVKIRGYFRNDSGKTSIGEISR